MPNIPGSSIIILDNTSNRNKEINNILTLAKAGIQEWLKRNDVSHSEDVKGTTPNSSWTVPIKKIYAVDEIFTSTGHTVIHLMLFYPIELVWGNIK